MKSQHARIALIGDTKVRLTYRPSEWVDLELPWPSSMAIRYTDNCLYSCDPDGIEASQLIDWPTY